MKKLLSGIALCAALLLATAPAANATVLKLCGYGEVAAMRLFDGHTPEDCIVSIEKFDYIDKDGIDHDLDWGFVATATGSQINLALLKAQNVGEEIIICVEYDINCGPCGIVIKSFECPGPWHGGNDTSRDG